MFRETGEALNHQVVLWPFSIFKKPILLQRPITTNASNSMSQLKPRPILKSLIFALTPYQLNARNRLRRKNNSKKIHVISVTRGKKIPITTINNKVVKFLFDQYLYLHNLSARLGIDILRRKLMSVIIIFEFLYHCVTLYLMYTRLQE